MRNYELPITNDDLEIRNSQFVIRNSLPIRIEIEDTGPGVAPEEMDKLFESFGQTESGRKANEGTGLGLPISRKFVQLMGGDITVKSEVGRGTIFQFTIEVQVMEQADVRRTAKVGKRVLALEPGQAIYRILVVDDRWTNRQLLLKLLQPLGFEVREAENGQQAIELWESWRPHLIWMDMRMPVMDGYEATRHIKAHASGQATAVIALTASILEEERAFVLDAGCDDFMRKPFREAEIFDMMTKHIGARFVYEESDKTVAPKTEVSLMPMTMAELPADLLKRLAEAATRMKADEIDALIEEVRVHNSALGETLADLAHNFEYTQIAELVTMQATPTIAIELPQLLLNFQPPQ